MAAYRIRSADHENAGNMDAAIADAKSVMDISGTAKDFAFFYDALLRSKENNTMKCRDFPQFNPIESFIILRSADMCADCQEAILGFLP